MRITVTISDVSVIADVSLLTFQISYQSNNKMESTHKKEKHPFVLVKL